MGIIAFVVVVLLLVCFVEAETEAKAKRRKEAYDFQPPNALGDARFATDKDLRKAGYFKSGGIRIGFSPDGLRALAYHGKGHVLLVAAARAGKAFTVLVTTILSLPRRYSLVIIDPKLELACIVAHHRKSIGPTYVLNPFKRHLDRLKGIIQAWLNPMDVLDVNSSSFHAGCDKISLSLWSADTGMTETHWKISAGLLISGIIAYLKKYGKPEEQNLPFMRDVLTGATGESIYDFCRRAIECPDPFIRQKLARFAAPDAEQSKELAGIISTADTQTGFLGNEDIANSLKSSSFRFRDLKRTPGMTVIVGLPLEMLDVADMYFRLISATMLFDLLEEGSNGGAPVLCVFDEVAQIGPMKILSDCLGMGAGAAGLQMLLVYQSISQAMAQFPHQWQNIIQNCGVSLWFGSRDQATRQTVSDLAGVTAILSHSRSVGIDQRTGEPLVNDSSSQTTRPLIYPHEVGALASDEMLMFCEGVNGPVKAQRKPYLREFRGRYRDNPYFQKTSALKRLFEW